jgi:Gas vesicle synthesis protein GvpL/GvpF
MPRPRPHEAVLRWAAEEAPRLLAEARAEALQEAHARLRGELVDALMSAARAAPSDDPAPATSREPAARDGTGHAVWVYGVMRGDVPDLPACPGIDERHNAELIRDADLAAIVSSVPRDEYDQSALEESLEDLKRLETLARGHERVLDEALRLGPVVPFRICTIYENADHVREMLARERPALADALDRLNGVAEWGVKGYLVAPKDSPAEKVGAGAPASGTDYLARKHGERDAAEAVRRVADTTLELIHGRLSEHALDAALSRVQDRELSGREEEMVLNAAYLVPDARIGEFQSLVQDLSRRHAPDGILLELTGPWPAYHFAGAWATE